MVFIPVIYAIQTRMMAFLQQAHQSTTRPIFSKFSQVSLQLNIVGSILEVLNADGVHMQLTAELTVLIENSSLPRGENTIFV